MFGLGRRKEEPVVATLEVPQPQPVVITDLVGDTAEEYMRTAEAVGWGNSGPVLALRLERFFHAEGICIYPLEAVEKYLTQNLKTGVWCWRPFRACDLGALSNARFTWDHGHIARDYYYDKPVPLPVLLTVEKIVKAFPDSGIHFYVSDIADPRADPFLSVRASGMNPFVIERWSEPGFRL